MKYIFLLTGILKKKMIKIMLLSLSLKKQVLDIGGLCTMGKMQVS